jgi:hypothetical protein
MRKPLEWFGLTFQKDENYRQRRSSDGPAWSPGTAADLRVRAKNYRRTLQKQPAAEALPYRSMYECISCDAIKSSRKIEDIVGRLVSLERLPRFEAEKGADNLPCWTRDCPLPRILCVNLMFPYSTRSDDPGCSFVAFFHIRPEVLRDLQHGMCPPSVEAFRRFCNGPAGAPLCRNDPHRSLHLRRDRKKKLDQDDGVLKATAWCENVAETGVNSFLASFNGKPTVITKSGYVVKESTAEDGPPGEWMEFGVDIREFNWMARKALVTYKSLLPLAAVHLGFMIQCIEDEDLPEGLVCDIHVQGVNIEDDPYWIDA